jgi:hypothetical protein
MDDGGQTYQTLSFVADLRADDISFTAQRSTDLAAWSGTAADVTEVSRIADGVTGKVTITVRSSQPYLGPQREFLRFTVTKP